MSRHIYFWNNTHMSFGGIINKVLHLLVGIKAAVQSFAAPLNNVFPIDNEIGIISSVFHANRILGVKSSPGTLTGQFRIFFNFYTPALIVAQVEVQPVHFVEG